MLGHHECFCKKENRDKRAKELRSQGMKVSCHSMCDQLLDPKYVEDADHALDGNYKMNFPVIYILEEKFTEVK